MNRDRCRAASPRSAPSRRRQARASGAQPAVCTAISRGARFDQPGRDGDGEPCASALAKAPPPTWTNSVSTSAPLGGQRLGHFEGERARAFHRQPVVGPLHAERNGAGRHRGARGAHAGVAGLARLRRSQTTTVRAELAESPNDARLGVDGDEDVERPIGGAGDHRCGQRGVAAGGDRQAPARAGPRRGPRPDASRTPEIEHDAREVAALVRSRDVARLVLDPQVAGEAERRGERRLARHRRDAEAASVDRLKAQIEFADQVDPGGVGQADARAPAGRASAIAGSAGTGCRRSRGSLAAFNRRATSTWSISSPARALGQANGKARAGSTTAPQPWQTNGGASAFGHDSLAAAPLSALNFAIIASHAGARSSRPSQNA